MNAGNAKFLSNSGRAIDLSKITILNSTNQHKSANTYGNIVIMSDGKAKTTNSQMKGFNLNENNFLNTLLIIFRSEIHNIKKTTNGR